MQRKLFTLALAALMLTGYVAAEDRALVVGVGRYSDPGANLPGIDRDVQSAQAILHKLNFKDSQIKVLFNEQATSSNILGNIRSWLTQGVGPNDRVVFYFSGHGTQLPDDNGDESDSCDEGIVPYDLANVIRDDELAKVFGQIRASETLVLLDSCFSGTATRSIPQRGKDRFIFRTVCNQAANRGSYAVGTEGVLEQANNPSRGLIEFTAAQNNEYAAGDSTGGFFTTALYNRVVKDGRPISFNDLRDYAVDYIQKVNSKGSTPGLEGPDSWRTKNFFSFGKLHTSLPSIDSPEPALTTVPSAAFQNINDHRSSKLDLSSNAAAYRINDLITFQITSPIDGYLNILEYGADGQTTLLYPNNYNQNNQIQANVPLQLPTSGYRYRAIEPTGPSQILAIVTKKPADLLQTAVSMEGGFRVAVSQADFNKMMLALGIGERPVGIDKLTLDGDAFYASALLGFSITR